VGDIRPLLVRGKGEKIPKPFEREWEVSTTLRGGGGGKSRKKTYRNTQGGHGSNLPLQRTGEKREKRGHKMGAF